MIFEEQYSIRALGCARECFFKSGGGRDELDRSFDLSGRHGDSLRVKTG
jgi:hypothetical protein